MLKITPVSIILRLGTLVIQPQGCPLGTLEVLLIDVNRSHIFLTVTHSLKKGLLCNNKALAPLITCTLKINKTSYIPDVPQES